MNIRHDIFDFYLSEAIFENRRSFAHLVFEKNALLRLRAVAKEWLRQLRSAVRYRTMGKRFRDESIGGKVWVFFNTKNQYDSLQFLRSGVPDVVFVTHEAEVDRFLPAGEAYTVLPVRAALPVRFLPRYGSLLWGLMRNNPQALWRAFHYLLRGIGQYEVFTMLIRQYGPRAVVASNDHSVHCRALCHAGNTVGVPTIFFQHASIAEDFPPMRFKHACLEGQDTLEKYLLIDPDAERYTRFWLIGMPKFDRYHPHINRSPCVRVVGLPLNMTEPTASIMNMVTAILDGCRDLVLKIRPHPADRRSFNFPAVGQENGNQLRVSNGTSETAFDFLSSVDLIVSGDSSIHLEAALLNVVPVYYTTNPERDHYGYASHGLVEVARSTDEVVHLIRANQVEKIDVRHRAKRYYAPLGTQYDGQSAELGRQVVNEVLNHLA